MAEVTEYTLTATDGIITGDVTCVDPFTVKEDADQSEKVGYSDEVSAERGAADIISRIGPGSNPNVVPPKG